MTQGLTAFGHLTSMSDESGGTSFSYDLHNRLLSKMQIAKISVIDYIQTLGYQYDSFGRVNQMTYPSGTIVATTYGVDDRPIEIRVNGNLLMSNITYHSFGEPKNLQCIDKENQATCYVHPETGQSVVLIRGQSCCWPRI